MDFDPLANLLRGGLRNSKKDVAGKPAMMRKENSILLNVVVLELIIYMKLQKRFMISWKMALMMMMFIS